MPALDRSDLEAALKKKGFTEFDDRDHKVYKLIVDNKKTGIFTKTSRGSGYKTLSPQLVSVIAKQIALSAGELVRYVECSISLKDYLNLVAERRSI